VTEIALDLNTNWRWFSEEVPFIAELSKSTKQGAERRLVERLRRGLINWYPWPLDVHAVVPKQLG
jgi:hypothetical protein